jgi:predicted nucleotidyltransferase
MGEPADLTTLLAKLAGSGVEFILVGGLAAVAQGAPITTFDVDVVHRRTGENVDRLLHFLATIAAHHRGHPTRRLPPDRTALLGPGHSLFATDLGPLDVLGAIEEGKAFDDLLPDALTVDVGGHPTSVLSLEALVRLKRNSTHSKDKLRLPVLEALLRRR